ncbi:hypothetical protein JRQ81_001027, partial [Phrynocephalus forsythii]
PWRTAEINAWLLYDEGFRMKAALKRNLDWGEQHIGLWLRYMTPVQPATGDQFD